MENLPVIMCDDVILASGEFGVIFWKKNRERLINNLKVRNQNLIHVAYNTITEFHLNEPFEEKIDDDLYRKSLDFNHMRNFSIYNLNASFSRNRNRLDVKIDKKFDIENIVESERSDEYILSFFNKKFVYQNVEIEVNYIHGYLEILANR